MAIQLSQDHFPELLSWLEQHLPACFKVYGELKSHLRGQCPAMEFFADRWPHPQALVARENPAAQQMMTQAGEVGVFGVDERALGDLLQDPRIVFWNKIVQFSFVPSHLEPLLATLAAERGKSVFANPLTMLKATPQDVKPIPIPEGLIVQPISNAEIKVINSTWKFSNQEKEKYVKNMVEKHPSLYLVTESGLHVGHMASVNSGAMGMLYVHPDFRRKGYAKVIISQLSQKYFDRGEDAYVFVEVDNFPSQNVHKSLGFREVSELKYTWLECS